MTEHGVSPIPNANDTAVWFVATALRHKWFLLFNKYE
jgi:hypothetical protein